MGCGCDDNTCSTEFTSFPILEGCPADTELILVSGAAGGVGIGKYALRSWGDLKACITGTPVLPLIGVVGGGGADDPTAGLTAFQSNKLIGIGSLDTGTGIYRIQIVVDGTLYANYGTNSNFSFDSATGTITGFYWETGAGLYIDLNQ